MGGRTNLRHGAELVGRPASFGHSMDIPCLITDLERLAIWILGDSPQEILDMHSKILRCGIYGSWVSAITETGTVPVPPQKALRHVSADEAIAIPKMHISPGLTDGRLQNYIKREDSQKELFPRTFFAVIQGRSGAAKSKLILRWTQDDLAREIFYEAANGYATVFSGAVLKSQVDVLSTAERFQKVQSVQEMDRLEAEGKGVVGVMC